MGVRGRLVMLYGEEKDVCMLSYIVCRKRRKKRNEGWVMLYGEEAED